MWSIKKIRCQVKYSPILRPINNNILNNPKLPNNLITNPHNKTIRTLTQRPHHLLKSKQQIIRNIPFHPHNILIRSLI
jgi:hypothetical protein